MNEKFPYRDILWAHIEPGSDNPRTRFLALSSKGFEAMGAQQVTVKTERAAHRELALAIVLADAVFEEVTLEELEAVAAQLIATQAAQSAWAASRRATAAA